jgi:alanyl-tRNA synthetase
MTTRLYYTDAVATAFEATVMSSVPAGNRFEVVLDQTLFYPTSGGQPFDTGRLGPAAVVDVFDRDDGSIVHVVDAPLDPGASVAGTIDWGRRFDHMQQHTGQHVLSAAFARLFGIETSSVHFGATASTIDLAREVAEAEADRAEAEANRIIWEDRPVAVRFATVEDVASLPIRKPPVRTGPIRLVDVTDFDLSACGGTHVPTTGRIGIAAVSGLERFKGGTRVTFVCGERARRAHAALRDRVAAASRALGVAGSGLDEAITRIQAESASLGRRVKALQGDLAEARAREWRAEVEATSHPRVVLRAVPGWDQAGLSAIARAIVSAPGWTAVLAGDGTPTPVVVARSADVPFDAAAWMRHATGLLGGRGGGRPDLAEGGLPAAAGRILDLARETLKIT